VADAVGKGLGTVEKLLDPAALKVRVQVSELFSIFLSLSLPFSLKFTPFPLSSLPPLLLSCVRVLL
jgi:hypothetical protein